MADQIPTSFQQCVLKTPLTVAANLRYVDANGDLVTRLYPNDYTELIGSSVSAIKTQIAGIDIILSDYNTRIADLEADVLAIQTSGVTFMLYVNGGCLNGNVSVPITTSVTSLIANTCAYNTILGTTTALALSVGALGIGTLNSLPAFSQNSAMSGLANWKSSLNTTADLEYNLALAYLDSRAGISTALAAVTPTCAQVVIDYQSVSNTVLTFLLYFNGYTFIPTGYTDNSSLIRITDTDGNFYQTGFNIVTASTSTSPVTLSTSGSTLSPTSVTYQIQVTSKVQNIALNTTCDKVVIRTVNNPSTGSAASTGPDIGTWELTLTSGSVVDYSYIVDAGVAYTPRYVSLTRRDVLSILCLTPANNSIRAAPMAGGFIAYLPGAPFATSCTGKVIYDYALFK